MEGMDHTMIRYDKINKAESSDTELESVLSSFHAEPSRFRPFSFAAERTCITHWSFFLEKMSTFNIRSTKN